LNEGEGLKIRYECEPKRFQFRVYGDDPNHYIAVCQIYQYGDRGFVDSMMGRELLEALGSALPELTEKYGIRTLEGYVLPDIYRALSILTIKRGGFIEKGKEIIHGGRTFIWITIKR
jgi:hypothetical protein